MKAIFVTARLKSTRLPYKVLLEICGRPLISYQLERIRNFSSIPIIICTSTNKQDDALSLFAQSRGYDIFRGSEEDVLGRYFDAAQMFGVSSAYITYADEPFVDIDLMNLTFDQLNSCEPIWVRNDDYLDGIFGYGLNLEALKIINQLKANLKNEVWGEMVSHFPLHILKNYPGYKKNELACRLTIDYPEDLMAFEKIVHVIGEDFKSLSVAQILALYQSLDLNEVNGFRSLEYNERIRNQDAVRVNNGL